MMYTNYIPINSTSLCSSNPYLTINNDIKDVFRFRYVTDRGSHGGLQATIELHNCNDPSNIYIKASLYTNEESPKLHTNVLHGNHCDNGVCWKPLSEDFTAEFSHLPILITKNNEKEANLKERIRSKYEQQGQVITEEDLLKKLKVEMKKFNNFYIKFCFEAFYYKDETRPVCDRIFSKPVKHEKQGQVSKKLNICRISKCSGKASGNEDFILLCNKINKDDIENVDIIFFSVDNHQNVNWEEKADFKAQDVHYGVAIPFKTPPYKENVKKEVFIQLRKKTDGMTSNIVKFTYKSCHELEPERLIQLARKRKRLDLSEDSLSKPSTSSSKTDDTIGFDDYLKKKSPLFLSSLPSDVVNELLDSKLPFEELPDEELPNEELPGEVQKELIGLNLPFDKLPDEVKELYYYDGPDDNDPDELLSSDGVLDSLASLSIREQTSDEISNETEQKQSEKKSFLQKQNMICSEIEHEIMLKKCVFKLINESSIDTFFRFLPALMSLKDENENNILHLLVLDENKILSLLLEMLQYAPSDLINQINKIHMTPLMIAVSKRLWSIVRILLKFGADPNINDENGNNCVHLAAMYGFPWCIREFLAPLLGDSTRKYLLDVNSLNCDGLAPLHLSIISNSRMCTELLVQANANVNVTDGKCGKTPLHFANERNSELVEFLLTQPEIDPYKKDYSGNIPSSCIPKVHKNASPGKSKLDQDSLMIALESNCCKKNRFFEYDEENYSTLKVYDGKEKVLSKNEAVFCKELDSNGLWRKLALYLMDDKTISIIALVDPSPTKTVLNQIRNCHGENYGEALKFILCDDDELKQYAKLLYL